MVWHVPHLPEGMKKDSCFWTVFPWLKGSHRPEGVLGPGNVHHPNVTIPISPNLSAAFAGFDPAETLETVGRQLCLSVFEPQPQEKTISQ